MYDPESQETKTFVRGYKKCGFHQDILNHFTLRELRQIQDLRKNWTILCVGGGRIDNSLEKKHMKIYGYSKGYGLADHSLTLKMMKEVLLEYTYEISNDGY